MRRRYIITACVSLVIFIENFAKKKLAPPLVSYPSSKISDSVDFPCHKTDMLGWTSEFLIFAQPSEEGVFKKGYD